LWARLDEDGAQVRAPVYVAVVGVAAELSTLRDLHLVGEKFDVQVLARDLAGKPFAGTFTLKALRREKDESGLPTEREVRSLPVPPDPKEGKGKASLNLDAAGDSPLRLAGQDPNGNSFTADLETQVVGDDDQVRLRILTDTDTFKLGETAPLRI